MRILTRHIYRAFPELDRYGDEQCIRFVRAARGGWMRRAAVLAIVAIVFGLVFVAGMVGVSYGLNMLDFRYARASRFVVVLAEAAILTAMVAPAPVAAYLVRDVLLRRRVRYALRSRGVCQSCWYSLVGLAVDPPNRVTCPECGGVSEVDPALGELVTSPDGRVRFKPEFEPPEIGSRFWTPARRRTVRRTAAWVTAVVVIVGGLSLGGYELFLRWQAATARAARGGQKGLEALPVKFGAPAPGKSDPDCATLVREMGQTYAQLCDQIRLDMGLPSHLEPEFLFLYADAATRSRWVSSDPQTRAEQESMAREVLGRLRSAGLLDQLDRLAAIPAWQVPELIPAEGSPFSSQGPWELIPWAIYHATIARANLEMDLGRSAEAARAIEHALAMNRLISELPVSHGHYLVSTGERALAQELVGSLLPTADAAWLDAVESGLERQAVHVGPDYVAEVERFWADEHIAWFFADPGRVRLGRHGREARQLAGSGPLVPIRLGTWSENHAYTKGLYDSLAARARQEPWQRPAATANPPAPGLLLTAWSGWLTSFTQESRDIALLQRRGLRVMIALERFRIDHGAYPGALSELVPRYTSEVPIDPFVGRAISYKTIDPATDPLGRGYLLYSIGLDGADDGGATNPTDRFFPLKPACQGLSATHDYVINQPPPP